VDASQNVWVYWNCDGKADVSEVLDMSMGGLFLKTPRLKPVESVINLHFLVQEGQIRADATVRYVRPGGGMGMKFAAVRLEDRSRLAALMTRLRWLSSKNPLNKH
jgi:PilZ domain